MALGCMSCLLTKACIADLVDVTGPTAEPQSFCKVKLGDYTYPSKVFVSVTTKRVFFNFCTKTKGS